MEPLKYILMICTTIIWMGCQQQGETEKKMVSLNVTATAYNAVEHQTKKGSRRAAWGDLLEDGVKAVAVSRDLIAMGLDHNEEIEIEGFNGTFIVKDKMNRRWTKKIDIFMGLDEQAAKEYGKRQVEIRFNKKNQPNDKFSQ
ncbi:hypothetical protein ESV24_04620 [Aequorivita lipolytica]|uniref:3D domain-containing protein n=2 Tax=Aequorivita lipolytica TaxID=153267 RepID=A0A5C6YST8_9FLAO|nr:hypothetical protein ESV24_04620 [Aequorivita lipolytica]